MKLDQRHSSVDLAGDARPGLMDPIKIALFLRNFQIGGAERQAFELAKRIDKHRFEVMVIALRGDGELKEAFLSLPDLQVVVLDASSSFGALFKLCRTIRRNRIQLLQSFLTATNVYSLFAKCFVPKVRIILGLRDSIPDFYLGYTSPSWRAKMWVLESCLNHLSSLGDLYISNSEAGKVLYDAKLHIRATVVSNGIDTERFKPDLNAQLTVREALNVPLSAKLVGILGNCTLYKDYPTFIRAARILMDQGREIHFIAIGEDRTPLGPGFKKLVKQYSLQQAFHFLGSRMDVARLLPGLDVLCSSSITEGFSNAIAEAMACGVPCVVTDVGDSQRIVGSTGVVVARANPEALAVGVAAMLDATPLVLQDLRSAARKRIVEHFDAAGMAAHHQQLYESLVLGATFRCGPGALVGSRLL